jgi:hypothetical protein
MVYRMVKVRAVGSVEVFQIRETEQLWDYRYVRQKR